MQGPPPGAKPLRRHTHPCALQGSYACTLDDICWVCTAVLHTHTHKVTTRDSGEHRGEEQHAQHTEGMRKYGKTNNDTLTLSLLTIAMRVFSSAIVHCSATHTYTQRKRRQQSVTTNTGMHPGCWHSGGAAVAPFAAPPRRRRRRQPPQGSPGPRAHAPTAHSRAQGSRDDPGTYRRRVLFRVGNGYGLMGFTRSPRF